MMIVITNRTLTSATATGTFDIKVTKMGVTLDNSIESGKRIHTGILLSDNNTIRFSAQGNERQIYDMITPEEASRPWVFFVHGFHQDPDENIEKAYALSKRHEVNVINFAWPSRPLDETLSRDDIIEEITSDALKSKLGPNTLIKLIALGAIGYLKDKWKNYVPAIENAEASDKDLFAAIKQVFEKINFSTPPVLLIHSMGNYLLQNSLSNEEELPQSFSNIVLHQPDVSARNHDWVENLIPGLTENAKLYITANIYDYVLAASSARSRLLNNDDSERLGHTRHEYLVNDRIYYLDFSHGIGIENDHEMFKRLRADTNPHVFDCLGNIFRAESSVGLPTDDIPDSSGFTKITSAINLFMLSKIVDPVDGEIISPVDRFPDPQSVDRDISFDELYADEDD